MKHPAYPKYKPSDVEWLGDLGTGTSGYREYSRRNAVRAPGKAHEIAGSAPVVDPAEPVPRAPAVETLMDLGPEETARVALVADGCQCPTVGGKIKPSDADIVFFSRFFFSQPYHSYFRQCINNRRGRMEFQFSFITFHGIICRYFAHAERHVC